MLIKSFPKYSVKLPSGKKIKYRPFTVKEENSLLIAKQSENNQNVLHTLIDVMNACIEDNTEEYEIQDFEAAFLHLRSKSIGEIEKATIKCPDTKEQVKVTINILEDMKYNEKTDTQNSIIQLENKILIRLQQLKVKDILQNPDYNKTFENKIKFIANNIISIQKDDELITAEDMSLSEKAEFCMNLQSKDFKKLLKYYEDTPKTYYILEYKTSDGESKKIELSGLFNIISFFLTI